MGGGRLCGLVWLDKWQRGVLLFGLDLLNNLRDGFDGWGLDGVCACRRGHE